MGVVMMVHTWNIQKAVLITIMGVKSAIMTNIAMVKDGAWKDRRGRKDWCSRDGGPVWKGASLSSN
jgi:hypothetical protein